MTDPNILRAARERGAAYKLRLIEEAGGWMSADEVAAALRIDPGDIWVMIADGRLLALDDNVPACLIADGHVLPGLAETIAVMEVKGFWTRLSYLLAPDSFLNGRTPIGALRAGALDPVLRAAAGYGRQ